MNFLQKIKVKTAVENKSKMELEASHDTSTDFGQFGIVQKKWLPMGEYKIDMYTFSNMQPMPQPTFGKVKYTNRLFWVPMHTIMKSFNDGLMDNMHVDGNNGAAKIPELRYIKIGTITKVIASLGDTVVQANADYTFTINGSAAYRKITSPMAWAIKFMQSLGYKWFFNDANTTHLNAMTLLAACKIYLDYYYNCAYVNDSEYLTIKKIIERDNGNLEIDETDLTYILAFCNNVYYDADPFVSAWENPNHPNISNQESTFSFVDPNGQYAVRTAASEGTYTLQPDVTNSQGKDPTIAAAASASGTYRDDRNVGVVTQWAIDSLRALTMYLKRHQLAGGETLARYLARFGIELYSEKDKKSQYLGAISWGMNVSPIFSNADTANGGGEQLGSYAGTAYAESSKSNDRKIFNLKTNEWGILMAINTVIPKHVYYQGIDGENLVLSKTDLWTPEFDNIGVEAITKGELVMPSNGGQTTDTGNMLAQVFGLSPRYFRFKMMRDMVTGNYVDPRYKNIFTPYLMLRTINDNIAITGLVHSKAFTKLDDGNQYDRIYYSQPNDKAPYDNINLHHEMHITAYTGMKPAYDYYDWEHEGGWEVEMQNNGATMN